MIRSLAVLAVAAAALTAACGTARPASAQATSAPSVAVFTTWPCRTRRVMQSFAYDPAHRVWVFAQLTWGKPASAGDLTLTRVSASGARLGWMHLRGFGHGLSIGIDGSGGIWTETHATAEPARGWALAGSYGSQIARFAWRNGATLTPAMVERFGPNANAPEQTPSVDAADGLIAVQYWSAGLHAFRWAVYSLAAFRAHRYTALARFTVPAAISGGVEQGWALASRTRVGELAGRRRSARHVLTLATAADPGVLLGTGGRGGSRGAGRHDPGRAGEPVHRVRVRRRGGAAGERLLPGQAVNSAYPARHPYIGMTISRRSERVRTRLLTPVLSGECVSARRSGSRSGRTSRRHAGRPCSPPARCARLSFAALVVAPVMP